MMPHRQTRQQQRRSFSSADDGESDSNISARLDASSQLHQEVDTELERERNVWDAFREEHFEAIEQLPLTLHRQFTLMRELDLQASDHIISLLPTLQAYVSDRRRLVPSSQSQTTTQGSITSSYSETHGSEQTKASQVAQQKLSHVVCLSEEFLRASEEKVNLAQAAYDSVDRHIRLLDQIIKEQEASIALGVRPGSHLAPIMLPDLIVPRWSRATRAALSPIPSLFVQEETAISHESEEPHNEGQLTSMVLGVQLDEDRTTLRRRRGKKGPGRGNKTKRRGYDDISDEAKQSRGIKSVKLTVPPLRTVPLRRESPELYCYCRGGSFGDMVACDGQSCNEWFHLACAGLTQLPSEKETWYCRNCNKYALRQRK